MYGKLFYYQYCLFFMFSGEKKSHLFTQSHIIVRLLHCYAAHSRNYFRGTMWQVEIMQELVSYVSLHVTQRSFP